MLFGGRSNEQAISFQSGVNVLESIDRELYNPIPVFINNSGDWLLLNEPISLDQLGTPVTLTATIPAILLDLRTYHRIASIDVILPLLHGKNGEDGSIQGLAQLLNLPCVGSTLLGASLSIDKDTTRRIAHNNGIPTVPFRVYYDLEQAKKDYKLISSDWHKMVVKPSRSGSSIGVTFVQDEPEYQSAIELAFKYDSKILVDYYISGREIEVGIRGTKENLQVSVPGEILTNAPVYSYSEKYSAQQCTKLDIPADLPPYITARIQKYAIQCCQSLLIEGMSRIDFFVRDNSIFLNEINAIPGFTKMSMYPMLWKNNSVSLNKLLHALILDAFQKYKD